MKILIIDDQPSGRRVVRQMLGPLPGVEFLEAAGVVDALSLVERASPDLLLLETRLGAEGSERHGLALLRRLRDRGMETAVVLVSASRDLADMREGMRLGARDYLPKSDLTPDTLLRVVEEQRERLMVRGGRGVEGRASAGIARQLIGSSPAMDRVRRMVGRLADAQASVLLSGETGTGKEVVARALHAGSPRRAEPFVAVNCSALPGTLIESLIFGHERGAFTGADRRMRGQLELAGSGTLLLDEIAEMPLDLQAKLLRVLEDRRFRPLGAEAELPLRARVVAATHVDIAQRVREGRFREDLFHRINVVSLRLPSLAERRGDIPELLAAFVREGTRPLTFTDEAVAWLTRRAWPGNVRELKNVIERLMLLADEDLVDARAIEALAPERPGPDPAGELDRIARSLLALPRPSASWLDVIEQAVMTQALEVCGGNKAAAARLVGVDRKVVDRRFAPPANDESDTPSVDTLRPFSSM